MSGFYEGKAKSALSMLQKRGQKIMVKQEKPGEYDPATGRSGVIVSQKAAYGAVFGYKQGDIDGTLVQASDRRVLLDASANIKVGDRLIVGPDELTAINVSPFSPGGVVVYYEVQARGQ